MDTDVPVPCGPSPHYSLGGVPRVTLQKCWCIAQSQVLCAPDDMRLWQYKDSAQRGWHDQGRLCRRVGAQDRVEYGLSMG